MPKIFIQYVALPAKLVVWAQLSYLKGPLKYLVAKLHRCYPGAISVPVSQNFFARFFRCWPLADSSCCLTFSLRCNKHETLLLTFLLINGLLYRYNMCVVRLFFILECFACRKMSSMYRRRLHVTLSCWWGNFAKATAHNFQCQIRNLNLKDGETQTKISITLQTLCPQHFWPLRNSLKSFAIEMCDLVNLCPLTVLPNLRNSTV